MTLRSGTHEFHDHDEVGFVFGGAFALLECWTWHKAGLWWCVNAAVSAAFTLLALIYPVILESPNRVWTKLGLLLSTVVNPMVTGLIFFPHLTLVAVIRRMRGHIRSS